MTSKIQLKKGIKVEMEHIPTFKFVKQFYKKNKRLPSDKMMATKIAKDHLKEDKKYYTKLKRHNL